MVRAFLFGAGATKSQYDDAPVCADFFDKLRVANHELFSHLYTTVTPHIKGSFLKTNVEDVMNLMSSLPHSIQLSFLESVHQAIYILLVSSTKSDIGAINAAKAGQDFAGPTLMKTLLTDKRLNTYDFFMTLNYDLYLYRELLVMQNYIDYGFAPLKEHGLVQTANVKVMETGEHTLFHLHGALNWEYYDANGIQVNDRPIFPKYAQNGSNLCLVPPGVKKISPTLKLIWEEAEKRVTKADELIIIGSSLNSSDKELIQLVELFVKHKGAENVKVIFQDKESDYLPQSDRAQIHSSSQHNHYKTIIGKDCKLYPHGFKINGPIHNPKYGALEFVFE